jgi:hypothetical protein
MPVVMAASVMRWLKMKSKEPASVMITYTDGTREHIEVNKKMRVLDAPSFKTSLFLFLVFIVVLLNL